MTSHPPVTRSTEPTSTTVWDPFVRLFHWSLVTSVSIATATGFLAGATWDTVHIWAGIVAAVLVVLRIVWGVLGPTHARFTDFVAGPAALIRHVKHHLSGAGSRYRGHNPLGGAMVVVLLVMVLALTVTGLVVLGGTLKVGPLAFLTSFAVGREAHGLHKLLAVVLLGLVALHLGGVVFESWRTRENLARAMVDGQKDVRDGDHTSARRMARPALAVAIAAVLLVGGGGTVWQLAAKPGLGVPPAALDPTYAKECGDCHTAYHPSLLPRASWAKLMAGLDDHFGENASLDPATEAKIARYLQANAAEAFDTKAAHLFRRVDAKAPFTITDTPLWRRIHRRIPKEVFASKAVGNRGNCAACHADAKTGRFYPGAITLPSEARP